jgi:hypothetical protein
MSKPRFSVRDAIADMPRCRYQSTRTPCPVYHDDETGYYTATSGNRRPPETDQWKWIEVPDQWAQSKGWHIWKAKNDWINQ